MQASMSEKLLIINCALNSVSVCTYDTNYKADLSLSLMPETIYTPHAQDCFQLYIEFLFPYVKSQSSIIYSQCPYYNIYILNT